MVNELLSLDSQWFSETAWGYRSSGARLSLDALASPVLVRMRWGRIPLRLMKRNGGGYDAAAAFTPVPIGQDTPVPPRPQ
jgi:hypothetical protein